jgi:hypothetical protein
MTDVQDTAALTRKQSDVYARRGGYLKSSFTR